MQSARSKVASVRISVIRLAAYDTKVAREKMRGKIDLIEPLVPVSPGDQ
jgi:hypothetical protein